MLDQAKKDIEIQTNNARKELLKDVGDLAVKIVKKFVSTEEDKEKKASMDQLVAQVEEKMVKNKNARIIILMHFLRGNQQMIKLNY